MDGQEEAIKALK